MGVNEMRVKILPLLCRLGLVLRLGSVQFELLGLTLLVRQVSPPAVYSQIFTLRVVNSE